MSSMLLCPIANLSNSRIEPVGSTTEACRAGAASTALGQTGTLERMPTSASTVPKMGRSPVA
ncbi:MAG: hypothetical protein ACI9U2_003539 [Bradymonadia bacterium]